MKLQKYLTETEDFDGDSWSVLNFFGDEEIRLKKLLLQQQKKPVAHEPVFKNTSQIRKLKNILEMTYKGNIGFEEMVEFYQKADDATIKKMEVIVKKEDWNGFKKLIYTTIGKRL